MAYLGVSPSNGVRKVHTYTATASQTTFSGAGAENISLSYRDSTYIDVYQNGVKLGDADYTATSGTSVVLGTGASASDIVVVVVYDVFSVADTVSKTDGGQFDGAVTFAGAFTSLGIDDNADATAITIDSDENIAIGVTSKNSSNNGSLTIGHTGMTKVSASASGNADELILIGADASANVGMSIIANNANHSNIFFGDEDDTDIGGITYDHSDNGLKFTINASERMRIDAGGSVLIGKSTPTDLHNTWNHLIIGEKGAIISENGGGGIDGISISDNAYIDSDTGGYAYQTTDEASKISQTGGNITFSNASSGSAGSALSFSERMRIHSGGHITCGTSSFGNHFFVYEAPTGGNAVTKIRNSSSNSSNQVTLLLSINERNDTSSAFLQGNNGFSNFYLFANGTHSFTSDENRKKNIETTRDGYLEDLAKLRVVKYNWKEQEDGEDKELGLIAQEVEKVFPKLVMEDPNDASDTDETKFKMIKTSVLPLMLLKALQEANTKITALEARITALEGE